MAGIFKVFREKEKEKDKVGEEKFDKGQPPRDEILLNKKKPAEKAEKEHVFPDITVPKKHEEHLLSIEREKRNEQEKIEREKERAQEKEKERQREEERLRHEKRKKSLSKGETSKQKEKESKEKEKESKKKRT